MVSQLIKDMAAGDRNAILRGIQSTGTSDKSCGICFAAIHRIRDSEMIAAIRAAKEDADLIYAYRISDFAIAALDILGVEKYTGDNELIQTLIHSKFAFLEGL